MSREKILDMIEKISPWAVALLFFSACYFIFKAFIS